jgi:hypothetical protein
MDGVIWVFIALLVPLIALGMLAGLRRRPLGVDPPSGHCSNRRAPMSPRRVSLNQSLTPRGIWKCPHSGKRMNAQANKPMQCNG